MGYRQIRRDHLDSQQAPEKSARFTSATASSPAGSSLGALLLEDGVSYLLLEDGSSKLLLG